ncbi:MAG: T9SS type A sorting domain-containing protein [Bacteroidales bacterium]
MKLKLMIALLLSGLVIYSQPVFEHTYSESANMVTLEGLGEVYYSMDVINRLCLIYSMDHTLIRSIPLPVPEGYYLEDIQFLSTNLFNDDNLLELIYIYSRYVPTEYSYYFTFETKLINENGLTLLTFPGAGFTNIIETAEHGKKFLVYQYDYSVIPYRTYTHVYQLPETTGPSLSFTVTGFNPGDPFPNPASQMVTIPVPLPDGVHSGSLEIVDMNGREMLSYPVTESTGNVFLPAGQLASGTYLYHIRTGNLQSEARKFVIR